MNQVLSAMGISSVNALVSALVTLLICIIAIKIITNIVNRLLERSPRLDATLRHYIGSGVRTLLWILAVIIVAGIADTDRKILRPSTAECFRRNYADFLDMHELR